MPTLLEKPPTTEQPEVTTTSRSGKLLPISLLIGWMLIVIVAALRNDSKSDEEKLEALQAKVDNRELLEKYEKETYCELLWKVKGIQLCTCKKNFINDIGSLTGYKVKDSDLDWRESGKTFEEALQEAFRKTGVPKDQFFAKKWALDNNGKSAVVQWEGPNGSEVSIDAPHKFNGPDVFHIGFQTPGKGDRKIIGHIFLDCVPYFRDVR